MRCLDHVKKTVASMLRLDTKTQTKQKQKHSTLALTLNVRID